MTRYTRYKKTHLEASEFKAVPINHSQQNNNSSEDAAHNKRQHNDDASQNNKKPRGDDNNGSNKRPTKVCFACRKPGHSVENCTNNANDFSQLEDSLTPMLATGICYHCESIQHSSKHCTHPNKKKHPFKFATCFHCRQTGHLAGQCPTNERGLYPDGGGCKFCGSVKHLAKDCKPAHMQDKGSIALGVMSMEQGGDDDDVFLALHKIQTSKSEPKKPAPSAVKKPKIVRF
ncbi:hypothetical protein DSO57_1003289 [Entomophthora muscae]|uniref:Uncharacterized protein n=1 Tax=Entomophthora muscae TaxID=34485 RepID=A0ACC2T830_9FUNG|nr:hypothetical protein DSO57_1003289 [Entomophthora muscae]